MAEKKGFSAAERAAMRERAKELKAAQSREESERAVLEKIAAMPGASRAVGERLHAIITSAAPEMVPRTWYGMPAYAKDGKVVCFFRSPQTFKERYTTLGFNDSATLDEGLMWPTAFAITRLGAQEEQVIAELVRRAVSGKVGV